MRFSTIDLIENRYQGGQRFKTGLKTGLKTGSTARRQRWPSDTNLSALEIVGDELGVGSERRQAFNL